jgi:hypothetical protein
MRKRKVTESLKTELSDLKSNRNKIDDYLTNFLINYSSFSRVMHSQINPKTKDEDLKIYAYQYLSSIITCWETFFRDLFVYLITIDSNLKNEIIKELKVNEDTIQEIEICEYLSKCFNFQDFQDIIKAFYPIFNASIFDFTAKDKFVYFTPNQNKETLFSLLEVIPDYNTVLKEGMNQRHKMIHDGNFMKNVKFNSDFIKKTETVFLLFPQILSRLLSDKYNLSRFVISNGKNNYNYLFLIMDLISDDWKIEESTTHNNGYN